MLEEILIAVSYCVGKMDVDEKADADFDVVLGEEYSVGASDSEVVFCSADDEVEEVMTMVVVYVDA